MHPYLKNAHDLLGKQGANTGGMREPHPTVVCQDDHPIDLGLLSLDQFLQRQVNGTDIVNKGVVIWLPFSFGEKKKIYIYICNKPHFPFLWLNKLLLAECYRLILINYILFILLFFYFFYYLIFYF